MNLYIRKDSLTHLILSVSQSYHRQKSLIAAHEESWLNVNSPNIQISMRKNVFISYSRSDNGKHLWLERLTGFLDALQDQLPLNIWDDSKIPPGAEWSKAIDDAISNSVAAVLLVGPGFLKSRFITEKELPEILKTNAGGTIRRIYILYVASCEWEDSPLAPYQAFNKPAEPLASLKEEPKQNKWLNDLCTAIMNDMKKAGVMAENTSESSKELYVAMQSMQNHLETTKTAFDTQLKRADKLLLAVQQRLEIKEHLEYEQFFFRFHDRMNEEEHFEFDQLRALTDLLAEGNEGILKIIEQHPTLREVLPILGALKIHLTIWLNKYKRVFSNNAKMALCFTGVEDGVPFPFGVDDEVDEWLRTHRT